MLGETEGRGGFFQKIAIPRTVAGFARVTAVEKNRPFAEMSNRPKPSALKKILGNPGKRKFNDNEPKPAIGEPEMPKLSRVAAKEWKRIVPILMSLGILTIADGSALAMYCAAYARWQQAEQQLSGSRNLTSDKANKLNSIADKSIKFAKSMLIEFGLTPASRPRLASFCILPMAQESDVKDKPIDTAAKYFSDPRSSNSIQ